MKNVAGLTKDIIERIAKNSVGKSFTVITYEAKVPEALKKEQPKEK